MVVVVGRRRGRGLDRSRRGRGRDRSRRRRGRRRRRRGRGRGLLARARARRVLYCAQHKTRHAIPKNDLKNCVALERGRRTCRRFYCGQYRTPQGRARRGARAL